MAKVKIGDKVKVLYHGKLEDGTTFDSSEGREPLSFTVGQGQVIKGFEKAVEGMEPGEKKTVRISVEDAYGHVDKENFIEFSKEELPEDLKPEVGLELHLSDNEGNNYPVVISEIRHDSIILDANHPLAGKNLIFDIELVSIG